MSKIMILQADDVIKTEMFPGFERRTLLSGSELMLCLFEMREGSELPAHSHPHEQVGFVISGAVDLTLAGGNYITRSGCCYFAYRDQPHSARVLENAVVVDAFSPPRKEYLPPAERANIPDYVPGPPPAFEKRLNVLESSTLLDEEIMPGLLRRNLLSGDRLSMCLSLLKAGCVVPKNTDDQERAGFVLSGHLELTAGDRVCEARARTCFLIPVNTAYSAVARENATVVEVFARRSGV